MRCNVFQRIALLVAGAYVINLAAPAAAQNAAPAPETAKAPAVAKADGGASEAGYTGPRISLLVFPFDTSEVQGAPPGLGESLAKMFKDGTLRSTIFTGVTFNPKFPVLRRALDETTLSAADMKEPFTLDPRDAERAAKIGRVMDMPVALGSLQDFNYDREKKEATVTITAEIINSQTGRIDKTLVASGKTPASMVVGTETDYLLRAAEAAGQDLLAKIPGVEPVVDPVAGTNGKTAAAGGEKPVVVEPVKKKKSNSGLWAALAVLAGIIIAGSGGGGGGGGTATDGPPAPPY